MAVFCDANTVSEDVLEKLQRGHVELTLINELYEKASKTPQLLKDIEKRFADAFGEDGYSNPFHERADELANAVKRIKEDLTQFVAHRVAKIAEIVNSEEVSKEFADKDFDARAIRDYVKRQFDERADELSLKSIEAKAAKLVSYGSWDTGRKPIVSREGTKLKLYKYMDWSFGGTPMGIWDLHGELAALERLAHTAINGAKPSDAIRYSSEISSRYSSFQHSTDCLNKQEFIGVIRAVKVHKNGNLYVWLRNESSAAALASALVHAAERR